jgi:hypothetical protein
MSKNLNSKLKKEHNCTYNSSKRGVKGPPGAVGRIPYGGETCILHELR